MKKTILVLAALAFSASTYAIDTVDNTVADYLSTYHIYKIEDGKKHLITSASSLLKENEETPVKIERTLGNDLTVASEGFEIFTKVSNKDNKEVWDYKGTLTSVKSVKVSDDKKWTKVTSENLSFMDSVPLEKARETKHTATFKQDGENYVLESSLKKVK